MGAALTKKVLFGLRAEDYEGTPLAIRDQDVIPVLAEGDPAVALEQDEVERDLLRDTLTMVEGVQGTKAGTVEVRVECNGPKTWDPADPEANTPVWDLPLRAAGFKRIRSYRIDIQTAWSAGSGTTLPHGTTITFTDGAAGGSQNTARVISDYIEGDDAIFYESLTGEAQAGDTNIEATVDATAIDILIDGALPGAQTGSLSYETTDVETSTMEMANGGSLAALVGDEIVGSLSGARGRVTKLFDFTAGGTIEFEKFEDSGNFTNGENVNVVGTAAGGNCETPTGETQKEMPSCTVATFDNVQGTPLKGARASWSAAFTNGNRVLWTFSFDGPALQPFDHGPTSPDGDRPEYQLDNDGKKPPTLTTSEIRFDADYAPLFTELTLSSESQLKRVEFPSDISSSGFSSTKITNRAISGQIDPRVVRESIYPIYGNAWDKIATRLLIRVGAGQGDGNSFEFKMNKMIFQSPTKTNAEGIIRNSTPVVARGVKDDDFNVHVW